jgi:hypothetical protein
MPQSLHSRHAATPPLVTCRNPSTRDIPHSTRDIPHSTRDIPQSLHLRHSAIPLGAGLPPLFPPSLPLRQLRHARLPLPEGCRVRHRPGLPRQLELRRLRHVVSIASLVSTLTILPYQLELRRLRHVVSIASLVSTLTILPYQLELRRLRRVH